MKAFWISYGTGSLIFLLAGFTCGRLSGHRGLGEAFWVAASGVCWMLPGIIVGVLATKVKWKVAFGLGAALLAVALLFLLPALIDLLFRWGWM